MTRVIYSKDLPNWATSWEGGMGLISMSALQNNTDNLRDELQEAMAGMEHILGYMSHLFSGVVHTRGHGRYIFPSVAELAKNLNVSCAQMWSSLQHAKPVLKETEGADIELCGGYYGPLTVQL